MTRGQDPKGPADFVRDTKPLDSIARRLNMPGHTQRRVTGQPAGAGACAARRKRRRLAGDHARPETEVEMKLPAARVSPQIAGTGGVRRGGCPTL